MEKKKFKIIEESRFLTNKEMSRLQGGKTCDKDNSYSVSGPCAKEMVVSCTPGARGTFTSDPFNCGTGMNFYAGTCSWWLFAITCGSNKDHGSKEAI